jgi:hypothetical protein
LLLAVVVVAFLVVELAELVASVLELPLLL